MPKVSRSTFEQPYEELNDGLTQHSVRLIEYPNDIHSATRMEVTTHLPPFVLTSFWKQMHLSEKDVYKLGEQLPARYYWAAVLVSGTDVSATALKPSYAHVSETTWSLRAEAIRTLIQTHNVKFTTCNSSLDTSSPASMHHVPPLPVHEVDDTDISRITQLLHHKHLMPFQRNKVRGLFDFNGSKLLPINLEGTSIWMQRAAPYADFQRSQKRQKYGCVSLPFIVSTPDNQIYALVEDGILVSARQ